jgi:hypothetical protein
MKLTQIFIALLCCGLCSCIVTAPRYTTVEKVFTLKTGMTSDEVAQALGIRPYNISSMSDTETVYLYKYRLTDRTTVPLFMGATNGKSVLGKYVNLLVTYNKAGLVTKLESCGKECDETIVETNQVDINKVITFLSVTLPIVLVFVGIKLGMK